MRNLAVCLASLALASAAHAEPQQASVANDRTTELWEEGKAAAQEGRWEEAWAAFTQAYALNRTLNIRYNLAMAAFHTKRYVEAARLLSEIADECDATCPEKIRHTTPERLKQAEQHVARISVRTDGGARILVDGKAVDQNVAQKVWHVSPGTHEVVVHNGEQSATRTVNVTAGQHEVVDVDFDAPSKPNLNATAPTNPHSQEEVGVLSGETLVLMVGGSLTALSVGFATGFTLRARSADEDAEQTRTEIGASDITQCSDPTSSACTELAAANDRRESAASAAKVSWAIAGALGVGTLATYFLWPKPESAPQYSIIPVGGSRWGGVVVQGAF